MFSRLRALGLAMAGLLTLASCSPYATESASNVERYATSAKSTSRIESVTGQVVSEAEAFRAMVELARSVAIALQDDSLRRRVFEAIHTSPYPEHKLHFRTFTNAGVGAQLLTAAAAGSGRSVESMRGIRDAAIDLEFYMPVKDHFARWTGDANLLVATSYDPDEDIPVAFALSGERILLTSAKVPPNTPALVLVRREASFVPPGLAALSAPGVAAGLYMTFSYINQDFEGWPNGDPEFEVHSNWRLSGDTSAKFNQCSGEDAGNPNRAGPGIKSTAYQYNQDDNTWSGIVRIIDSAQAVAAEAVDSVITNWVWEDDEVKCEIHVGNTWDPNAFYQQVVGQPRGWRNRWSFQNNDPLLVWFLRTGWNIFSGIVQGSNDDFAGLMVPPSFAGVSYSDANMAILHPTQGVVGRAMLIRFSSEPPAPPPSYQVSITGPTTVGPNNYTCTQWVAAVTAGQSPFVYSWYGLFTSSDSYVSGTVPQNGGDLFLVVTDNQGSTSGLSLKLR